MTTNQTQNARNIARASAHDMRFNLSDTGETEAAEGMDSHILNYDRATMTRAEFESTYPGEAY